MTAPQLPAVPPSPPKPTPPAVRAVAGFVVAHPVWSQVLVLVLASAASGGFAPLGAVLWVGGGAATAVWRHSLISSGAVPAPTRAAALPARSRQTVAPVGKSADRLRDAVAQLRLVDLDLPLDEQIEAEGETYRMRDIRGLFDASGLPITRAGVTLDRAVAVLCPEPWNPHDENAIAIMVGAFHVGYVPAELAEDYAPHLLRLAQRGQVIAGTARIWAKMEGTTARARVTVLAPDVDRLSRAV